MHEAVRGGPRWGSVERAVRVVRRDIESGRLPAGAALLEGELARRLEISRTPVREALAELRALGLVSKRPGASAVVSSLTLADLRQIYEIRVPLESLAAELAALERPDEAIAQMRSAEAALKLAAPGMAWSSAHDDLHMTLYRYSGRDRLINLITALRAQSEPYVRLAVQVDPELRVAAAREHAEMVELLALRATARLAKLTKAHLLGTLNRAPAALGLIEHGRD